MRRILKRVLGETRDIVFLIMFPGRTETGWWLRKGYQRRYRRYNKRRRRY